MVRSPFSASISTCRTYKTVLCCHSCFFLNHQKYNLYFKYLLSLFLIIPIVLLLISQPDIGQTMLIVFTWLALIFISGINLIIFLDCLGFLTVLLYLIFFVERFNYIKIRISYFLIVHQIVIHKLKKHLKQ